MRTARGTSKSVWPTQLHERLRALLKRAVVLLELDLAEAFLELNRIACHEPPHQVVDMTGIVYSIGYAEGYA